MEREYRELSAKFYQMSKPVGFSINGDIEFYRKELKDVTGLTLEAGVGTGRLLIPLIQSGIKMEGLDSSPEMLEQCRLNQEKYNVEAVLYEQNLIDLSLPKSYEAIIMPTGTFCLLDRAKAQEVLQMFYDHLNASGKLIIDIEMPVELQKGVIETNSVSISDDHEILLTSYVESIDRVLQKTVYINQYELINRGKIVKTERSGFILNWYSIEEFRMKLSLAVY